MPTKKHKKRLLVGNRKIKEVNRLIRLARTKWDAHENAACRRERDRALALYETFVRHWSSAAGFMIARTRRGLLLSLYPIPQPAGALTMAG